jgi:pimeloyl-ACP methyl ester carboxylesterase
MTGRERQELEFSWEGLRLAGTLHLPGSGGPFPAVLMMQGSGPADRDNDVYFPPLRDAFLERGIAVYYFDKPGVGKSTGDWRDHVLEGRAEQSAAALEAMARHPDLDAGRLGVWGHSQGGWLSQILASRLPEVAFAISNSGPAIGIEEQDLYGCEHSMRARGHPDDEIEKALAFVGALHDEARLGTEYPMVEQQLLASARNQTWYGYLTVDEEADWLFIRRAVAEAYDPMLSLRRIRCPYLAVFGGVDPLVPAWESARATGEALVEAGNPDATVVVFPGGDHRIQDPGTARLVAGYVDVVADWTARRAPADPKLPA